ncbi:MAG: DegV family protein [Gorillibacterium sp.]|nr:DegV family protein [Gorillibacterium sp.]
MDVKIITDSAADMPGDITRQYDIDVIPLQVIEGETVYLDNVTLDPMDLFKGMRAGTVYKTSQPAYQSIVDLFTHYATQGRSCLYPAFSSELSGTYQTAVMAMNDVLEEYPDFDIDIINTKCASFGEGLVTYKIAQLAKMGKTKAELIDATNFYAAHMEHIFTVDDLEYLLRGGRVSPIAAFIGGILNIKPILDVENGKLVPIEKIRGRKKVFLRIIEIMRERGYQLENQTIGISHGDDLEAAEQMASMIREAFGTKEIIISMIGSSVGAHSGPGTLAIFFLNQEMTQA